MAHYFIAGHLWLLAALAVFIGKNFEHSGPTEYPVFGVGRLFSPAEYFCLMMVPVLLSAGCFYLYLLGRRRPSE